MKRAGGPCWTRRTPSSCSTACGQDLTALSLAAYFAELTEAVSDGCGGDVLPLLLNALYALSALKKPPQLVKPAFQFRLMALAGYEPMADGCALCGAPQPENPMLDVVHGWSTAAGAGKRGDCPCR